MTPKTALRYLKHRVEADHACGHVILAESGKVLIDYILTVAQEHEDMRTAIKKMQEKAVDGYQGRSWGHSEYPSGYDSACSWFEFSCDEILAIIPDRAEEIFEHKEHDDVR
jgi:hypothetical protein